MKFNDKKVILFDLDGTLIDSVPDLASAVNHMLKALDRETFREDTIRYWVGNGAQMLVKRALSGQTDIDENLDSKLYEKALEIFLTIYAQNLCLSTVAYPNVATTLHILHTAGYRLAIVTNKPFDFVAPILKGFELDGLFEFWLGGDSLERKKPDSLPLLYACKKMDVSVEHALMVGDSKNDLLAAKEARMQSIGVTYGYNYGEDIALYQPDIVVDDFSDILTFLDISYGDKKK